MTKKKVQTEAEKFEEIIESVDAGKKTDVEYDIMNLESIHKLCIEKMCIRCPLFKYEGAKLGNGHCDCLLLTVPANWDLEEIERRLKNYGKEKSTDRS